MCHSRDPGPGRSQPVPMKPGKPWASEVPASTQACMSRSSSGRTRRVMATVTGWSSRRVSLIGCSEDVDALLGRQPHAVALADPERLVELVAVAHGVGADLGGRVGVDGEQALGLLGAGLARPHLSPADEEPLGAGETVQLG